MQHNVEQHDQLLLCMCNYVKVFIKWNVYKFYGIEVNAKWHLRHCIVTNDITASTSGGRM